MRVDELINKIADLHEQILKIQRCQDKVKADVARRRLKQAQRAAKRDVDRIYTNVLLKDGIRV